MINWKLKKGTLKKILIACAIVAAFVAILAIRQRNEFYKNTTESRLTNPPRSQEAYTDTFYADQLTEKEQSAYAMLKTALDEYKGGEIVFQEPLNGREFARVKSALECAAENYFYGMVGIPMTADGKNLSYDTQNILSVTDDTIEKCLLFLYCAEGVDENGTMDDNGFVTNLDALKGPLSANNEERFKKVEKLQKDSEEILDKVVADMPAQYGTKEAIDYFLGWMDENLTYVDQASQSEGVTAMSGLFEALYFKNYSTCVAEKTALTSGYAKTLTSLCNRAGIKSHVVMGTWTSFPFGTSKEPYIMTCVEIDGENIYVDAAGGHVKQLLDQRYVNEPGILKWMPFVDYFEYGNN